MGDEEKNPEPSLEPPKLFGRKKPRPAASPDVVTPSTVEPAPVPVEDDTPTTVIEAEERTQVVEAPERQTVPVAPPAEESRPLFTDEVAAPAEASPVAPVPPPVKAPKTPKARRAPRAAKVPQPAKVPTSPKTPTEDREPIVTGRVAAALTGLLVGAAMVGATAGSLRACEAVQGTASCGSAGFPILLAIVVAAVMVGSALLRAFRVPDAGSTSFLAVGSLAVIALLVFIDVLDRWWMIIVIPLVGVATYLLSHWVTTTFIEPAED